MLAGATSLISNKKSANFRQAAWVWFWVDEVELSHSPLDWFRSVRIPRGSAGWEAALLPLRFWRRVFRAFRRQRVKGRGICKSKSKRRSFGSTEKRFAQDGRRVLG